MSLDNDIELLDEYVNVYEIKKNEIKERLISERKRTIKSIELYNRKIAIKQSELTDINSKLCTLFGHTYSDWIEYPDRYLDRSWYYERKCEICGLVERSDYEPKEYSTQHELKLNKNKK